MGKNNFSYHVLKTVTSPFAKMKYKLMIENSEIVPEKGPVIICSNHLHKRDQLTVFYSTNRTIHYMAKKEYFQKQPTKTIYKCWGAIPTDRENGSEAMDTCQALLEQGEAIGIFPEGTRNALKPDEIEQLYGENPNYANIPFETFQRFVKKRRPKVSQIKYIKALCEAGVIDLKTCQQHLMSPDKLLVELRDSGKITEAEYDDSLLRPLRFGAVKLAQKTGAMIVTSAGDGNFDSGTVKFAYGDTFHIPHDCDDQTLGQYNDQIRKSIIETYKKIR